jgi:hypothetical protein
VGKGDSAHRQRRPEFPRLLSPRPFVESLHISSSKLSSAAFSVRRPCRTIYLTFLLFPSPSSISTPLHAYIHRPIAFISHDVPLLLICSLIYGTSCHVSDTSPCTHSSHSYLHRHWRSHGLGTHHIPRWIERIMYACASSPNIMIFHSSVILAGSRESQHDQSGGVGRHVRTSGAEVTPHQALSA